MPKNGEYVKGEASIFCKLELKNVLDIDVRFLEFATIKKRKKLTSTKLRKLETNFKLEKFFIITLTLIYYTSAIWQINLSKVVRCSFFPLPSKRFFKNQSQVR